MAWGLKLPGPGQSSPRPWIPVVELVWSFKAIIQMRQLRPREWKALAQEAQNQDLKASLPQYNSHVSKVPTTLKEAHQQVFIYRALLLCGQLWLG